MKLKNLLGEKLLADIILAPYTTFKIGGRAKYFFVAESAEDILKAVQAGRQTGVPYFILGEGSNLLVSDEGFNGLIIKIQNTKYQILNTHCHTDAGVLLSQLVKATAGAGLTGLEFAAGIPGTVGGAIFGNAGIKDRGVGNVVESVTLLFPDGEIKTVDKDWMEFGYRESKLEKYSPSERPIILSAVLKLEKGEPEKIKAEIQERHQKRSEKLPSEPSAGCIFKNLPNQSAGALIEQAGLKGKRIGDAAISEKHANFIINLGNAKADDILQLIKLIKQTVKEKLNVALEEEIQFLGFSH